MAQFLKIVLMLMNSLLLGFGYVVDNMIAHNTSQEFWTKNESFKYSLNLSILMGSFINENILEQDEQSVASNKQIECTFV